MNFVAVLAVLAASSFALPLLVQGGEALGLGRSVSVIGSLVLAVLVAVSFMTRAWLGRSRRGAPLRARRAGTLSRSSAGIVDAGTLRLLEAEEESRASL